MHFCKNRIRCVFFSKNIFMAVKLIDYFSGIPLKRRSEQIIRLNDLYQNMVGVKHTLEKCIKFLAQTEPYRMLRDWSYEIAATPLHDDVDTEEYTDVSLYIIAFNYHTLIALIITCLD